MNKLQEITPDQIAQEMYPAQISFDQCKKIIDDITCQRIIKGKKLGFDLYREICKYMPDKINDIFRPSDEEIKATYDKLVGESDVME